MYVQSTIDLKFECHYIELLHCHQLSRSLPIEVIVEIKLIIKWYYFKRYN